MGYETEKQDELNLEEYIALSREAAKMVSLATVWMSRATALHSISDTEKQAEIVAMRSQLRSDLSTALGI